MIQDLAFVCIQNGEKYSDDYVDHLYRAVRRHCSLEAPFLCVTDRQRHWNSPVQSILVPKGLPGWWQKIELFDPRLTRFRYLIFFDLDTVILRSIDGLLRHIGKCQFAHAMDCIDPLSTSLMLIDTQSAFASAVRTNFDPDAWIPLDTGDQQYLTEQLAPSPTTRSLSVEDHYSYKYFIGHGDWRKRTKNPRYRPIPFSQLITLNFHGFPKPLDLMHSPADWPYGKTIVQAWLQ